MHEVRREIKVYGMAVSSSCSPQAIRSLRTWLFFLPLPLSATIDWCQAASSSSSAINSDRVLDSDRQGPDPMLAYAQQADVPHRVAVEQDKESWGRG
jgi:hypothetical protein